MDYEKHILKGGYKRIVNFAENILLRPNDNIYLMGEEKFNTLVTAFENVLENYKDDEIYSYYYELPKLDHGFCTFERWKLGMFY